MATFICISYFYFYFYFNPTRNSNPFNSFHLIKKRKEIKTKQNKLFLIKNNWFLKQIYKTKKKSFNIKNNSYSLSNLASSSMAHQIAHLLMFFYFTFYFFLLFVCWYFLFRLLCFYICEKSITFFRLKWAKLKKK